MYRKKLIQRVRHILWGPTEVIAAVLSLLVILSRPVMDYLLKLWEGLPWWVGVLLLGALLAYALLRAGYELWKEEVQARQLAEAQVRQYGQERYAMQLENQKLRAMSPDEYRILQKERRRRIKSWREEIQSHSFVRHPLGGSLFTHTETYSDMMPLLPRDIRQRYESQFPMFTLSPRKIGKDGDRRVLLDEVSRIEKQWGLV